MKRSVVLDAGALIAAERADRRLTALIAASALGGATIVVPAGVVAEVWRTPRTQTRIASLLKTVDTFPALDLEVAKRVGELLAKARRASVVDGSVVDAALHHWPALIVTSDPNDLNALLAATRKGEITIYKI